MATDEQLKAILDQNAAFLMNMAKQQETAMQTLVETIMKAQLKDREGKTKGLDERKFKEVGVFGGSEEQWKEFALKFKAVAKETNPLIFEALKWAEGEENELTETDLDIKFGDQGTEVAVTVYNRLIHHLSGPALEMHQTVLEENGLEAWRTLSKRYDPMTSMRGLQLMMKVMLPPKIGKNQDVQGMINRWEGYIHTLKRDFKEDVSDMMKIGILIHMMPDQLQDTILQAADRKAEYKHIKEKVVTLVDARARLRDPNAMDIGYTGGPDNNHNNNNNNSYNNNPYAPGEPDHDGHEELGAVTEDTQCYRCGGYGHLSSLCATPKGKGKGKSKGKGSGLKGKGKGFKGDFKGKGNPCSHCGKQGHTPATCWTLHPELWSQRRAYALEEEEENEEFEVGMLECQVCDDSWSEVRGCRNLSPEQKPQQEPQQQYQQQQPTAIRVPGPPGLQLINKFEALAEDEPEQELAIGGLEIEDKMRAVNVVKKEVPKVQKKLVKAGVGKITVDSGAAESVMPKAMLGNETLVAGAAKLAGVKYVAANGARMDNHGEKQVRFKCQEGGALNKITFQVTDVAKPLASVSRILDKGNTVVFSRTKGGSYILNEKTGGKIPLVEEKGTFVMNVEYFQPEGAEAQGEMSGFTRQC